MTKHTKNQKRELQKNVNTNDSIKEASSNLQFIYDPAVRESGTRMTFGAIKTLYQFAYKDDSDLKRIHRELEKTAEDLYLQWINMPSEEYPSVEDFVQQMGTVVGIKKYLTKVMKEEPNQNLEEIAKERYHKIWGKNEPRPKYKPTEDKQIHSA